MIARTVNKAAAQDMQRIAEFIGDDGAFDDNDILVALNHQLPQFHLLGVAAFQAHTTFVHCFEVTKGFLARRAAECLLNYCRGAARAAGFKQALFVVAEDNDAMQQFLEQHGAVREPGTLYRMDVR